MTSENVQQILEQISSGDRNVEAELYELLRKRRFAYIQKRRHKGKAEQEVDDLFHDAFVVFLQKARSGEITKSISLWFEVTTKYMDIGHLRRITEFQFGEERPADEAEEILWASRGVPCGEAPLMEQDRWRLIHRAMKMLSSQRREIIDRFYFQDQTEEEIRTAMHITPTQFRLWKSRALAQLKKSLHADVGRV